MTRHANPHDARRTRRRKKGRPMLFLMVAFLLLGVLLGAVTHLPLPVTAVTAVVILGWLAVYGVRHRRHADDRR
ncbi:hypothetical protein [Streptantibioticus parmotrematis]|uniref:hypothetical protein n=1 Tax=Streptantibioticus parmotrematis TaxID=2873249 RepID=UPI003F4D6B89